LFVQHYYWVDFGGLLRWAQACDQGYNSEDQGYRGNHSWIEWLDSVNLILDCRSQGDGACDSEDQAAADQEQSFTQEKLEDSGWAAANGQPDSDFAPPLAQ